VRKLRALSEIGRKAAQWVKRFSAAEDGNIAMMFALSAIVIMSAAGGALDWSRAMVTKTRLGAALDAAGLAVGTANGLTEDQARAKAQQYFDANWPATTIGRPGPVQVALDNQSVSLSVTAEVPTTLLRIVHIDTMDMRVTNQIVRAVTKLRVALVLDNTGSMSETDSSGTSKISALKTASHQLLTQLQNAAINPGDVQVALIPFSLDVNVGTSAVGASWIDWTDWEAPPPNSTPSTNTGPGDSCPYGTNTSPYGYRCTQNPSNGSSNTNSIPSNGSYKGYIIPGRDSGSYNPGRGGHYYNGYYDSVATQTKTTTCTQDNVGGSQHCGNPVTTSGWTGDSQTSTDGTPVANVICDHDRSCTCNHISHCTLTGSGNNKVATQTVTTTTTVTKAGAGPWNHTWYANDHSSWGGCIMDRSKDYDTTNTTPSGTATNFPAENAQSCPPATVGALSFNWSDLSTAVDQMSPNGSTNQTIGFVWGWQALTEGLPLNAQPSDNLTSQVIIILSDGLNTQNRYGGDGSNQSTQVNDRETLACANAKAAGVIVYTLFVDLGGTSGNSAPLQTCATDAGKYFDLTTSGQIVSAFNQIGTELANLHLAR
jgi:Flp pilus assembly protein TadG